MQSKESRSEQNRSMSEGRTKANTRWYVIGMLSICPHLQGGKKVTGNCLVIWDIFQTGFVEILHFGIIHQKNERREVFLADLFYLLIHWNSPNGALISPLIGRFSSRSPQSTLLPRSPEEVGRNPPLCEFSLDGLGLCAASDMCCFGTQG